MTYQFLQEYWWFLVSLLGALLVFLMFVQGGNFLAVVLKINDVEKRMIINSTGRKWEITFTTLVTFGGAFFASFPLFYSTSFGGAYWVWVILLFTFVFQAVSYEFQNKNGNLIGSKPFRIFLALNGLMAPFLIGTAVGTFYTVSDFLIDKSSFYAGGEPVISRWGSEWHGLEALAQPWAVVLGIAVFLLAVMLGALYAINNIVDNNLGAKMRKAVKYFGASFVIIFVVWLVHLLLSQGFSVDSEGVVRLEAYKYLNNLLDMPIILVVMLIGVVLVLFGWYKGAFTHSVKGIWLSGIGTVITVLSLLLTVGYNDTAYYPSITDLQSSLTIRNSSSSLFTLRTMFWASLAVPLVVAYIAYAWHSIDRNPITKDEIEE